LAIKVAKFNGVSLVLVDSYNLDAAESALFTKRVAKEIEKGRPVAIDVGKVRFADSRGIAALSALTRIAQRGTVVLSSVNRRLARFLEQTPRNRRLPEAANIDDAVEMLMRTMSKSSEPESPEVLTMPERNQQPRKEQPKNNNAIG
jgi:anti-anti-sigma factor